MSWSQSAVLSIVCGVGRGRVKGGEASHRGGR